MSDSSMYSSLFALVDSHLSKTSLQENGGNTNTVSDKILSVHNLCNGSIDETLPLHSHPRLPIPTLTSNDNPVRTVLGQQVANMLRAKKKKEEKQKLETEMQVLKLDDENDSIIDLMKAIELSSSFEPHSSQQEKHSSAESLLKLNFTDSNDEPEKTNTSELVLPYMTDMSYILKEKVKMGNPSTFARVMTSRIRPIAAPYLTKNPKHLKRFDFHTQSPCDVIKANLRKPTMSCTFTLDITKFI